ncbi:MAG: SDR family NAD(P)-dependent oxidoreductase [Acidobacteria bacterium]|nr:SDR family NAD(P)-dependent oxidoreductase [Acidobacteriota bacterium]
MPTLRKHIAVVAGASRGAGRGIALALGDAGATVYVAGRTTRAGPRPLDGTDGTIEDTADEVTARGGRGIAVPTDCTDEDSVASLFGRVEADHGRIDILANAVWGMADAYAGMNEWMSVWGQSFWQQSPAAWRQMMDAGPRAYYLTSTFAMRLMSSKRRGLIVGVTDGYFETAPGVATEAMGSGQLVWNLSHLCINLLAKGMAGEAKSHKVAVLTLMPGFMRTERVVHYLSTEKLKQQFGFDHAESTEYLGRAVAALAADPHIMTKTGMVHFVADLAAEYGFTDVDGRRVPRFNPFGA